MPAWGPDTPPMLSMALAVFLCHRTGILDESLRTFALEYGRLPRVDVDPEDIERYLAIAIRHTLDHLALELVAQGRAELEGVRTDGRPRIRLHDAGADGCAG